MKTLVLILSILFTMSAHALIVSPSVGGSNAFDAAGAVKNREAVYIKVKNASALAMTAGMMVVDDLTADNGISVTTTLSAGYTPKCVIVDTSCAVGAMCKCQVYGYYASCSFDRTATDGTAGDATAGFQGYLSESTAGHIEARPLTRLDAQDHAGIIFLDAPSASGATECLVRTLGL